MLRFFWKNTLQKLQKKAQVLKINDVNWKNMSRNARTNPISLNKEYFVRKYVTKVQEFK